MDGLKPARPCLRAVGIPLNGCLRWVANLFCLHPSLLSSVVAYRAFFLHLFPYPIFSPTKGRSYACLACPFGVPYDACVPTPSTPLQLLPFTLGHRSLPGRANLAEWLHASLSQSTSNHKKQLFYFSWYSSLITHWQSSKRISYV